MAKGKTAAGGSVEQEILALANVKQRDGEDRQEFLKRVTEVLDKNMSQKEFDGLSPAAQLWSNDASTAVGKNKPVADFPAGDAAEAKPARARGNAKDEEPEPAEAEAQSDQEAEKAPAKRPGRKSASKAKATAKKAGAKPAAARKAAKARPAAKKAAAKPKKAASANGHDRAEKGLKKGMIYTLREFMLKEAGLTVEDLVTKLHKAGFKTATKNSVNVFRSSFISDVAFLKEKGYKGLPSL